MYILNILNIMSKKQDVARWRNLTKGRIAMMAGNITNILHSLPENKPLSQTEINNLIQIRKDLKECAEEITKLDLRMQDIRRKILIQ